MTVTTEQIETGQSQWTYEVTVNFVQVPDEKRDAYWAALAWFAEEIQKLMNETHECSGEPHAETIQPNV